MSILLLVGLLSGVLSACGAGNAQNAEDIFVANATATLGATPGVVASKVRYTDPGGMGAVVNVRVTADPAADLETVLADSLRAVSNVSGSLKPVTKVDFYVFPDGNEENGIRPDSLGLAPSPTMEEVHHYAE